MRIDSHGLTRVRVPALALLAAGACRATGGASGEAGGGPALVHSNPETLPRSPHYSHAVRAEVGSGRLVFVAGQLATDREGRVVGRGDVAAQAAQALENLRHALEANGATFDDILKVTVFVTDMAAARPALVAARPRYFRGTPPASTLVEVRRLAGDDYLIEIEAVAFVRRE
jgi:enamine deaminase RidA (YjgF/YER057c/UK114 family)